MRSALHRRAVTIVAAMALAACSVKPPTDATPSPPPAPGAVSAVTLSSDGLRVTWSDTSGDETGFVVEWLGTTGRVLGSASVGADTMRHDVHGLTASTTYGVHVKAINAVGSSPWSARATTTTFPNAPVLTQAVQDPQPSSSTIRLDWAEASPDETAFSVEWMVGSTSVGAVDVPAPAAGTLVAGLTPATTYSFRVRTVSAAGASAWSNVLAASTHDAPPAPATGFALAPSDLSVALSWIDGSTNETGFRIERAPDVAGAPGAYAVLATAPADARTFDDAGPLSPGTAYWYRVVATNGLDAVPAEGRVTTLSLGRPAAPAGLSAALVDARAGAMVRLAWVDASANETGFRVERALDDGTGTGVPGAFSDVSSAAPNPVPVDATAFVDASAEFDTLYFYRVVATNEAGDSDPSNVTSITPRRTWCGDYVLQPDQVCCAGIPYLGAGCPAAPTCGGVALAAGHMCCTDGTQGATCCGASALAAGNRCCTDGTQATTCPGGLSAIQLFRAIPTSRSEFAYAVQYVFASRSVQLTCPPSPVATISSSSDGTAALYVDNFITVNGASVCGAECFAGYTGFTVRGDGSPNADGTYGTIGPLSVTLPSGSNLVPFTLVDWGMVVGSSAIWLVSNCSSP